MQHVVAIAIGGAVGAVCRYGVNQGCARLLGDHFAFGTLAVNTAGCFLLGLAIPLGTSDSARWHPAAHSGLTIGFLGALTTFSTFGYDTARLVEGSRHGLATTNIAANVVLGLAAVGAGLACGRWLSGG
ncbi:MAG: CrcB family protein [Planctomycetota bacterium]